MHEVLKLNFLKSKWKLQVSQQVDLSFHSENNFSEISGLVSFGKKKSKLDFSCVELSVWSQRSPPPPKHLPPFVNWHVRTFSTQTYYGVDIWPSPPPPLQMSRVEITSAIQGFRQQIQMSPKAVSVRPLAATTRLECFYKGYFGQNKCF